MKSSLAGRLSWIRFLYSRPAIRYNFSATDNPWEVWGSCLSVAGLILNSNIIPGNSSTRKEKHKEFPWLFFSGTSGKKGSSLRISCHKIININSMKTRITIKEKYKILERRHHKKRNQKTKTCLKRLKSYYKLYISSWLPKNEITNEGIGQYNTNLTGIQILSKLV